MKFLRMLLLCLTAAIILATGACDNGSGPSDETTPVQPPEAPSDLTVTFNSSDMRNELAWTVNSTDEQGFVILCNTDSAGWSEIGDVGNGTSMFIHHDVHEVSTFDYRIFAYRDTLHSDTTDIVHVETPLFAPSQLYGFADINGIHLGWSDASSIEDGFGLMRRDGSGGEWALLVQTGENDVSYTDLVNLVVDTTYYYRVYARTFKFNRIVYSDTTDVASVLWQQF